jgi:hypothetical protein
LFCFGIDHRNKANRSELPLSISRRLHRRHDDQNLVEGCLRLNHLDLSAMLADCMMAGVSNLSSNRRHGQGTSPLQEVRRTKHQQPRFPTYCTILFFLTTDGGLDHRLRPAGVRRLAWARILREYLDSLWPSRCSAQGDAHICPTIPFSPRCRLQAMHSSPSDASHNGEFIHHRTFVRIAFALHVTFGMALFDVGADWACSRRVHIIREP